MFVELVPYSNKFYLISIFYGLDLKVAKVENPVLITISVVVSGIHFDKLVVLIVVVDERVLPVVELD